MSIWRATSVSKTLPPATRRPASAHSSLVYILIDLFIIYSTVPCVRPFATLSRTICAKRRSRVNLDSITGSPLVDSTGFTSRLGQLFLLPCQRFYRGPCTNRCYPSDPYSTRLRLCFVVRAYKASTFRHTARNYTRKLISVPVHHFCIFRSATSPFSCNLTDVVEG